MKKNLIKGILLIVLSVVLIGANSVFAADTSGVDELLNFDDTPSTSTTTPSTQTTTTTETKKEEVTTGNSSVYNNTTTPTPTTTTKTEDKSLSKTGIEDTFPMIALIAVFGVSAIFAFKKIKEYKNV